MRTVFAMRFRATPTEPDKAIQDIRDQLSGWIAGKYLRTWKTTWTPALTAGTETPLPNHKLVCATARRPESELITVTWSHPHERDTNCIWSTAITIARQKQDLEISAFIRIAAVRFELRPLVFDVGTPKFIRDLIARYDCYIDEDKITRLPQVVGATDVQAVVDGLLLSRTRRLPVIAISPGIATGAPLVDAAELGNQLIGFAHVIVLQDKWATWALADAVGKNLSCYGGAIRIYWPGLTLADDRFFHKLFLPDSIRLWMDTGMPLRKRIYRLLCSTATLRATESGLENTLNRELAEEQKRELEKLRDQVKSESLTKGEVEDAYLKLSYQNDALQLRISELEEEAAAQKSAWANISSYVSPAAPQTEGEESEAPSAPTEYSSVREAIEAAKRKFTGPLVFLDSAMESASSSPYQNPERVFQIFEALHEVAIEWRVAGGRLPQGWRGALEARGFEYKDKISATSKGKYSDEYRFLYKGQKQFFENHITVGAKQPQKCLSVHWFRDETDLTIVIGHCGRHLSNTSS